MFLVDYTQRLAAALRRAGLRFQMMRHGNRNAVERVFEEIERRTSSFANSLSMLSRRQQNRGFKPSLSGTTHTKVNATLLSAINARHRRAETGVTESLVAVVGIRKEYSYRVPMHQQQLTEFSLLEVVTGRDERVDLRESSTRKRTDSSYPRYLPSGGGHVP